MWDHSETVMSFRKKDHFNCKATFPNKYREKVLPPKVLFYGKNLVVVPIVVVVHII